jgi:hypothetical protein
MGFETSCDPTVVDNTHFMKSCIYGVHTLTAAQQRVRNSIKAQGAVFVQVLESWRFPVLMEVNSKQ